MTKIDKEEFNNMKDSFWSLLQALESKVNPQKDILDKVVVENGYKVWNRIFCANLKPRWNEENKGAKDDEASRIES